MKLNTILSCIFLLLGLITARAQQLQPGFDIQEYEEILRIIVGSSETPEKAKLIPYPKHSQLQYRSKVMGLSNLWELWMKDSKTAILCTRGSTLDTDSWLANIYAAMVPATGKLEIDSGFTFDYALCENSKAAVHVGYLVSTAYLTRDMVPKIDSCYRAGVRDFIITGHSQGGGISYLVTAYLYALQRQGTLPQDIRIKTYCSAPPKPGNLYFAYAYEKMTQGGWAFNVVNTEDWVPQMPFSVQTLGDLPKESPVPLVEDFIKKQSFFKRIFMRSYYKKMKNPSEKTVSTYQRFLGKEVAKQIKKYLPNFKEPTYSPSNDYVRTGIPIVLYPDAAYYEKFKRKDKDKVDLMLHHGIVPYFELTERYLDKQR